MQSVFIDHIKGLSLLIAAWFVFGSARPAEAAKFIEARIEKDGKVLFATSFTAADDETAAEMWGRLRTVTFERKGDVGADKKDQVLKEGITLTVVWRKDTVIAKAKVDQLQIVHEAKTDRWLLPAEEVERTAKAAGLKLQKAN